MRHDALMNTLVEGLIDISSLAVFPDIVRIIYIYIYTLPQTQLRIPLYRMSSSLPADRACRKMLQLYTALACILIILAEIAECSEVEGNRRVKRKVANFDRSPERKWTNPIIFKFDGDHTAQERSMVVNAIEHYELNTCLRFFHVPKYAQIPIQHLMFTRGGLGCFSFVGRITKNPQDINLNSYCFKKFGVPVHEIGHALGFFHEHQRTDRDEYISVLYENVGPFQSQFWRRNTISGGVRYDLGSVMQYGEKTGSSNGKPAILAKDPLYQKSMGQRIGLSYLDIKTLNIFYCNHICRKPLEKPCQHGGYQDPNSCSSCRCPDGFSGRYCDQLAPSNKPNCGGKIYATPIARYITSPGYDPANRGSYDDYTDCSWKITAPANHTVVLSFEDEFGIYCEDEETCYHWLEVKYKNDKEQSGPRFCCYDAPGAVIRSESRDMILIFKSNYATTWSTDRKGFRAKIMAESNFPTEAPVTTPEVVTTLSNQPTDGERLSSISTAATPSASISITYTVPTSATSNASSTEATSSASHLTATAALSTVSNTTLTPSTATPSDQSTTASTKSTLPKMTKTSGAVTNASLKPITTKTSADYKSSFTATHAMDVTTTSTVEPLSSTTSHRHSISPNASVTATVPKTTTSSPGVFWSGWSECGQGGCRCGGCTYQSRYRMCGNVRCPGKYKATETRPCDRFCAKHDRRVIYTGRFYHIDCPLCCKGYEPGDKKCVRKV